MIYLLLAMQAAGMIVDYMGAQKQARFAGLGAQVEQAGIDANIAQNRLESETQSLENMKQLRQTIGSQIAIFAARGTAANAGSSASILNESVNNFNADERIRRLNAMGRENQLRAGKAMSILQNQSSNSKLWQGFAGRTINTFPSSYSGWKQYGKDLQEGFGLTTNKGT